MAKTTAEATEMEWRALYDAADELKALAPWEWMLDSDLVELAPDGRSVLFGELGKAAGVYLRPTDGSPPMRLSDGQGLDLSPDGRVAVVSQPGLWAQVHVWPCRPPADSFWSQGMQLLRVL